MIKAVIFDFDHTLYDRRKSVIAAAPVLRQRLKEYLNPSVTDEQFAEAFFNAETSEKNHSIYSYQGVVDDLDDLGLFSTKPTKAQYLEHFYPSLSEHISMFPDAYDVLQQLKNSNYKVAILTNGTTKIQHLKLSYTRVPEYTDMVVVSDEYSKAKPHPEPFVDVCRRLGVKTNEAVYVGDQIYNDVCGARGAGMKTIWKPFVGIWPEDITPPDFTIENLSEIPAILEQL